MPDLERAAMVLGDILAAPLQHGSGLDEIACIGLPLVLVIVALWSMWRGAATDETGSDDPGPEGQ